jgi:hypothetical protein
MTNNQLDYYLLTITSSSSGFLFIAFFTRLINQSTINIITENLIIAVMIAHNTPHIGAHISAPGTQSIKNKRIYPQLPRSDTPHIATIITSMTPKIAKVASTLLPLLFFI